MPALLISTSDDAAGGGALHGARTWPSLSVMSASTKSAEETAQLGHCESRGLRVRVQERQPRAFAGELLDDRAADAPRASGHDRHFAVEALHRRP
jgi:hypothetical protein